MLSGRRACEGRGVLGQGTMCWEVGACCTITLSRASPRLASPHLAYFALPCVLCVLSLKRSNCKWQSRSNKSSKNNSNTTATIATPTTTAVIVVKLISSTAQVLCHKSFRCLLPKPSSKANQTELPFLQRHISINYTYDIYIYIYIYTLYP